MVKHRTGKSVDRNGKRKYQWVHAQWKDYFHGDYSGKWKGLDRWYFLFHDESNSARGNYIDAFKTQREMFSWAMSRN